MRRKLKRLTRKISDDQSLTKHPSIVKVPSLPAIMESPEVLSYIHIKWHLPNIFFDC